jgi:small-conductance mechanosensitive channel
MRYILQLPCFRCDVMVCQDQGVLLRAGPLARSLGSRNDAGRGSRVRYLTILEYILENNFIAHASRWLQELGIVTASGARIILILLLAWIATRLLHRAIRAFRRRVASHIVDRETTKRAETLSRVFRYISSVVVWLIATMLVLSEIGVSVAPILGAAGVAGLAIGFGAQSLVKDYFTGFFLLLENQIRQGDVIKVGDHAGLVEEVTLRFVQLRDYDGNVHFVPNGTITSVTNMSRGYANAVVDIGVAYKEDLDQVMAIMRGVAEEMRGDPAFKERILDAFELAGVERWDDSAVVIRGRFRVLPLEQWNVKREYLRRLKYAFDREHIEIPFPHLTLYPGAVPPGQPPSFLVEVGQAGKEAAPATGRAQPQNEDVKGA